LNFPNIFFGSSKNHSAFSGGDIFGDIKAETTKVANSSCLLTVVFGLYRMCAVLDYL